MSARLLSLLVVVVSLVLYHVTQRSMPSAIRPAHLFAFVYGIAMIIMLTIVIGGWGGDRAGTDGTVTRQFGLVTHSWAAWLLAVSVAGIELGVYAMYRSGWPLSTASLTSQSIAVGLLAIIGVLAFGEHLNVGRLSGLVLCAVGAVLLTR